MTLEERVRQEIERFRRAVYGEEVRESYANIAELVCIDAVKKADYALEQGDYAKVQGNYAKTQGDYAKEQGAFASSQTETALDAIREAMLEIEGEFGDIKDIINSTENGELLLEINQLLNDMYRQATDTDVDRIIAGTYVDEDYEGSIFEAGTNQDIDDIIGGTYTDIDDDSGGVGTGTTQNMTNIVNQAFQEV